MPKNQFEQVRVGMDKDQVLAIMESPQRTQRWHGQDRWTYIFHDGTNWVQKEVHFSEGISNYVGDTVKPEVSAADQDSKNEVANAEVDKTLRARKDLNQKAFSNYEDNYRGEKSIHYVPQFKPIE